MKEIPLTMGRVAIVDDCDYDRVSPLKWCLTKKRNGPPREYAMRSLKINGRSRSVKMHRFILGVEDSRVFVDHKNGDGLDNRRCNIRVANRSQNGANRRPSVGGSSKYLGVCWHKTKSKWKAALSYRGKKITIGYFDSERDAAEAYNKLAMSLHGEFANPNIFV